MNVLEYIDPIRARGVARHGSVAAWLYFAGVSESTYYRWLRGRTSPNARTLARLERSASMPVETQAATAQTVGA